jgi:hypothetical protein
VVFLWKCVHHLWIVRNRTYALIPEELLCGGSGAGKWFAAFEELKDGGHAFAGFRGKFQDFHAGSNRLDVAASKRFIKLDDGGEGDLVMTATSALLKIVGYFRGLSSPSVTERRTKCKSSPRS